MAKEGRGWRKWIPSKELVVRVFVALVAIKLIQTVVGKYVPPSVQPYLPNVT